MGDPNAVDQLVQVLPGADDYVTRLMELYEPVERLYGDVLQSTRATVTSCSTANLTGC